MWKAILTSAIASWMLTACASGTTPMPAYTVPVSANLKAPPVELPPATSGSLPDLWQNHSEVAEIYHDLADRYRRLVREIECR